MEVYEAFLPPDLSTHRNLLVAEEFFGFYQGHTEDNEAVVAFKSHDNLNQYLQWLDSTISSQS